MSAPYAQTWAPEEGLTPRFDCPECEYARTGTTTSRHMFETHLLNVHEYSVEEARRVSANGH